LKRHIPFLKYRYIAYAFSITVMIIFVTATMSKGGNNWGIDFVGGVKVTAQFKPGVKISQIKDAFKKENINASVQQIGEAEKNQYIIETKLLNKPVYDFSETEFIGTVSIEQLTKAIVADKYPLTLVSPVNSINWLNELISNKDLSKLVIQTKKISNLSPEIQTLSDEVVRYDAKNISPEQMINVHKLNRLVLELSYKTMCPSSSSDDGSSDRSFRVVWSTIKGVFPDTQQIAVETVGPSIGDYLRKSAVRLTLMAVLLMSIYLIFRFEFRFALGAMVGLLHDVSLSFFFCGVAGIEINIPIIAAILTIFGYSINDTIVVYDRIREHMGNKTIHLTKELIDQSVNETLSRTIITSLLTFLAVLAIYVLGGETLRSFAAVMLFGIAFGTYSSVYISSAIVYEWDRFFNKKK
jgi:preprotein translocase subunit SecF